jgi:methyl-accepting chemotaxis protein
MKISISTKINMILMLNFFFVSILVGTGSYFLERKRIYKQFENDKSGIVKRLSKVIPQPLYYTNTDLMKELCLIELAGEVLFSIGITELALDVESKPEDFILYYSKDANQEIIELDQKLLLEIAVNLANSEKHIITYTDEYDESYDIGVLELIFTDESVKDELRFSMLKIIINFLLIAISSVFILFFVFRTVIIQKIDHLLNQFSIVSSGDLTATTSLISDDELGNLSKHFQNFIKTLKDTINEIKVQSNSSLETSADLSVSAEQSYVAINAIMKKIETVNSNMVNLLTEVGDSKDRAGNINKFTSKVLHHMRSQSEKMDNANHVIDDMVNSVNNVTSDITSKLEVITALSNTATEGMKEMSKTKNLIVVMSEETESVKKMIDTINDIASVTNLLSINASIEASHAGIAGRGFAVIAKEIGTLANSTSQNATIIEESLKAMLKSIYLSRDSSKTAETYFKSLTTGISDVSKGMKSTHNTMSALSSGNIEVEHSLTELANIGLGVKKSVETMINEVKSIDSSLQSIKDLSSENMDDITHIGINIEEIHSSIDVVSSSGIINKENVAHIDLLLSKKFTT